MSATTFSRCLDDFCAHCLQEGIALNISSHVARPLGNNHFSVNWATSRVRTYRRVNDLDLQEYLECLRCNDFSILLMDGGLIQVSAQFDGSEIIESCFYYIPCPVRFEKSELEVGEELYPLEDFIEELPSAELKARLCIRAPFRFELDPKNAGDGHPTNHVHIGPSSSRIPVALSMCWNSFSRFIFKNFYPDQLPVVEGLLKHPAPYRVRAITEPDAYELHMTFAVNT
ncbi:DUF2290 domain-containing protein [Phaeobacter sp. A36a-5a]|uniref:DUF2290 domain-containing protein n=1 Tax=Phaeobacter bryozoorum TaxID=1086632 RepID=UPI0035A6A04C